jgi:hypothetical protein
MPYLFALLCIACLIGAGVIESRILAHERITRIPVIGGWLWCRKDCGPDTDNDPDGRVWIIRSCQRTRCPGRAYERRQVR